MRKLITSKGFDPKTGKKNLKIYLASQNKTEKFKNYIDIILKEIGHPEALITDLSSISDFCLSENKLKSISKKLGLKIKERYLLIDIAKQLKKGDNEINRK